MSKTIDNYKFTTDADVKDRIVRIELECVEFSLTITRQDSIETERVYDQNLVQAILNRAKEFNMGLFHKGTNEGLQVDHVRENNGVVLEVKLDPVNSINTFEIPI
jgi:hypothetical protein